MTSVDVAEATSFLESLLGKTLQIRVPDGRLFTGTFRCTDNESNIILSNSFEYRMPSKTVEQQILKEAAGSRKAVAKANMTSRFVGLIVIPGQQIMKVEVEERRMSGLSHAPALAMRGKG